MATYQEFSKKIKEKYPQYAEKDDLALAKKMIEVYPQYKDKVTFEEQPQIEEQPKTFSQKSAETVMGIGKSMIPPVTPSGITESAAYKVPTGLERMGRSVKSATQESLSEIARSPKAPSLEIPTALATTTIGTAAELAPFTPSEFGGILAGEMLPSAVYAVLKKFPKSLANRFLRTPQQIADARLAKGQPTVGEDYLESGIFNPEGFGSLPTGDKSKIYNLAKMNIRKIGSEVKSLIDKVSKDYMPGHVKQISAVSKSELAERPSGLNKLLDEMIKTSEKYDIGSGTLSLLRKVRNNDVLDFKTANRFREFLGEYIGKRFTKEEVPERIDSLISIFGSLRNRIGQISPTINNALQEQHILYDIMSSVSKEVARGYGKTSHSLVEMLTKPMEESVKAASIIRGIPSQRGVGFLGGGVMSQKERLMKRKP